MLAMAYFTPPPLQKVRKLYDKLQRQEQNRVAVAAAAASAAAGSGSSADAAPSQSGTRAPPPSFVPAPRIVPAAVTETANGKEERPAVAAAGETGGVDSGGAAAGARAPTCGASHGASPYETDACCRDGGDGTSGQSALQVGERLSEAVRLCSTSAPGGGSEAGGGEEAGRRGGGSLCALTLSEAELSRPRRLLADLRLLTSRPAEEVPAEAAAEAAAAAAAEAAAPTPTPTPTPARAPAPVGAKSGFLSLAVAEEKVRRADTPPLGHDPLLETAWLAERFPKVTLGDLLVNRLELSLWASYWNRQRPRERIG